MVITKDIYTAEELKRQKIQEQVNNLIKEEFENYKIEIKHGCSEFYKSFPKFNNINLNEKQDMAYDEKWRKKKI